MSGFSSALRMPISGVKQKTDSAFWTSIWVAGLKSQATAPGRALFPGSYVYTKIARIPKLDEQHVPSSRDCTLAMVDAPPTRQPQMNG